MMKGCLRQMRGGCGVVLCAVVMAGPATGQSRVEEPGTLGLTMSGTYGVITGNTRYGNQFEDGPGLTLGVRYVAASNWSVGLSFFSQTFDAKPDTTGLDKLRVTDITLDLFFYRDRNADASQYLMIGIGFYRPEMHFSGEEITFPGENLLLELGLGAEIFIKENWGLELSGRAFGYVGDGLTAFEVNEGVEPDGNFSVGIQGQVGIIYYLLR
jgi:hypothetical protein